MPSPQWRLAFELLWRGTDDAALDSVREALRIGKADCRDYADDFRTPRQPATSKTPAEPLTVHNANKWTLLHVCAAFNHLECAQEIINACGKAALRHPSYNGSTPLHLG